MFQFLLDSYLYPPTPEDELSPHKIAAQITALEQHRFCNAAYGDWQWWAGDAEQSYLVLQCEGQTYPDYRLPLLLDHWRPPLAYLFRRSTAEQLHRLQAWHPATTVDANREYLGLAAVLGCQFVYVPGSRVRHLGKLDLRRSTPNDGKSEPRQRLYQRFQDVAALRQSQALSPLLHTLLYQSWQLWQPCFRFNSETATLSHCREPRSTSINPAQQVLVQALLKCPQPLPLYFVWG